MPRAITLAFTLACSVATLSACSKPVDADGEGAAADKPSQAKLAPDGESKSDKARRAITAAFVSDAKRDLAAQFTASASEACASVKGQGFPDAQSGSPMQYTSAGVISWGKGSLDDVEEPGANVKLSISTQNSPFLSPSTSTTS